MNDYLFRGSLEDLDPEVHELTQIEAERQYRRLILIPSESTAPIAVREALASAFNNIYAEGYPHQSTLNMPEDEILDYGARLAHYRRYSAPRYYKGVEYADTVEALARRRCAELFAANELDPADLFVNVQPLSGAPANNAVYQALIEPGDTIIGMDLMQGGHLTHGAAANRSGMLYRSMNYSVDPHTETIDYDAVAALAQEHAPKIIIAGYSSYSWAPDWHKFREIADAVDAYLLADIAHIAGPIAAGVLPSPVGIADVVTFTTHKSLCGPRGGAILTHSKQLSRRLDRAVFPGEQGGPHLNTIAAQAVGFKLAASDQFRQLQESVLANCLALNRSLEHEGLRIPFGGTNTHLTNVDCSSITGPDGTALSGDMAARILDLVGIVVNRNTIPDDKSAARPSGIRLGSVWVTQRGFGEAECERLGQLIAQVLNACRPYQMAGRRRPQHRAKVAFEVLAQVQGEVRDLAAGLGIDFEPASHGYPHFYYSDDPAPREPFSTIALDDFAADKLIRYLTDTRPLEIDIDQSTRAHMRGPDGTVEIVVSRRDDGWTLSLSSEQAPQAVAWLRALSDGYVEFDTEDLQRKPPGPLVVRLEAGIESLPEARAKADGSDKPWYLGAENSGGTPLPAFEFDPVEAQSLKRTALFETHQSQGAKLIPFAGCEMPVWYSSVLEEHTATRSAAGLFDVCHMGVFQVEGEQATAFLDGVVANDVASLGVGQSHYTHFLNPEGNVLDDAMVYHRSEAAYLVVVNAANNDKLWTWLLGVQGGEFRIDSDRPWSEVYGRGCVLRNLRHPAEGDAMRVDLALQGPASRDILIALGCSPEDQAKLEVLPWAGLMEGEFGGFDLVVSRTGYTGERVAYELFVHPEKSVDLWNRLIEVGEPVGLKPTGLGARDSLRTEAGLPLYGHELAGEMNLGVGDAGFATYVKTHKPWFIGRSAFLRQEKERTKEVVRFRFKEQRVRMAHYGDLVANEKGDLIGSVTSCAIDSDRYLTGQAHILLDHTEPGTPISIFQGTASDHTKAKGSGAPAEVLRRFPRF
ncbi:MAG: glycine cleavage system aminomethyltransferase GcvT [Anaerolineales bacterium]